MSSNPSNRTLPPSMSGRSHWSEHSFIAVDVEGNGRQPPDLVELAIVRIVGGEVRMPPIEWLVRPPKPITWHAMRVHGIANNDVQEQPSLEDIRGDVRGCLDANIIVGHRVSVDCGILQLSIPDWAPSATLDTWKLAKKAVPSLTSYALSALIEELGLVSLLEGRPHRAGYDALAAAHVFIALAKKLDGNGGLTLQSLLDLCGLSPEATRSDNPQGSLF